jgi:rhodanese-related sulfurtransferase
MAGKSFKDMLAEANAVIDSISIQDAQDSLHSDEVVFVDVRESQERAQGFIPESHHAPRGFLEFIADPQGPMHNPALAAGKRVIVYCGSGGRSALAAKTLVDMGVGKVANLVGGFQAWVQSGGDVER